MARGHKLITYIYRALREDKPRPKLKIEATCGHACPLLIMSKEWGPVHSGDRKVSTSARFKLIQYNVVHLTYL